MIIVPNSPQEEAIYAFPAELLNDIGHADDVVQRMRDGAYLSLGCGVVGTGTVYLREDTDSGFRIWTKVPVDIVDGLLRDKRIKTKRKGTFGYGVLSG